MPDQVSSLEAATRDFLRNTDVLRVTIRGREIDFRFPNSVWMRNVIVLIFQGKEYPTLPLPDYVPTTIVDVGANVGASAIYWYNAYPTAKIYCYEPSMENFVCLRENTRIHADQLQAFPYGLLDKDCELPLYRGLSQTGQNSVVPTPETSPIPTETVRLVKASREAAERGWQHISILKVDTEGCEVPILTDLFTAVPSIDIIYCEYHSEENRKAVEALTGDRYSLAWSKANEPHLGMSVYIANSLLRHYPQLDGRRKSYTPQP